MDRLQWGGGQSRVRDRDYKGYMYQRSVQFVRVRVQKGSSLAVEAQVMAVGRWKEAVGSL